jgi:hypothetical protein
MATQDGGTSWPRPNRVCCICGSTTCDGKGVQPQRALEKCTSRQRMLRHWGGVPLSWGRTAASQPANLPIACRPLWVPDVTPPVGLGQELALYGEFCKRECGAVEHELERSIGIGGVLRDCSEQAANALGYDVVDMVQYGSRSVGLAHPGISDMDCAVIVDAKGGGGNTFSESGWRQVQQDLVCKLVGVIMSGRTGSRGCFNVLSNAKVGPGMMSPPDPTHD